jgi:hypothetical protein
VAYCPNVGDTAVGGGWAFDPAEAQNEDIAVSAPYTGLPNGQDPAHNGWRVVANGAAGPELTVYVICAS